MNLKRTCFKLGIIMVVFFVSGMVCSVLVTLMNEQLTQTLSVTARYCLRLSFSGLFLYIIPIVVAKVILRDENQSRFGELYKKPPRMAKALGNFPAMYGLGQITNLTALFVVWIISKLQSVGVESGVETESLERSFGTMNSLIPPNIICGIVLFIHMVFAAALFEEYLCRGLLLDALKPYGKGFSIIVTGFLFGIMHGNLQQFFYTFVVGIVLAYITVQTGSILAATVLHALFNSLSGVMMLFLSTKTVQEVFMGEQPENKMSLALFGMFFVLMIGLIVAGIALAIRKLSLIKSHIRAISEIDKADALEAEVEDDNAPESKTAMPNRWIVFFTSVPVIFMLVLTVERFTGSVVAAKLYEMIWG